MKTYFHELGAEVAVVVVLSTSEILGTAGETECMVSVQKPLALAPTNMQKTTHHYNIH